MSWQRITFPPNTCIRYDLSLTLPVMCAFHLCPSSCIACCRYEASALTLRSLRREVLCLLSASSKVLSDPQHLLGQALDAPEPDVVEAAVDYLQQVRGWLGGRREKLRNGVVRQRGSGLIR